MIRLSIALFLVQAGFHGFTASIPVALAHAGRPDSEIGAIVGVAAIVQIGAALVGGVMIDRFGMVRLLVVGGLCYVVSAALLFYVLTIAGVFRLRATRPDAERPYKAFGYPVVPALYIVGALAILVVLLIYRPATTWPGFVIVLLGIPVFVAMRRR